MLSCSNSVTSCKAEFANSTRFARRAPSDGTKNTSSVIIGEVVGIHIDESAGRFGEFGDLVAFVCSERAGYINGSVLRIDGRQIRPTVESGRHSARRSR